MASCAIIGRWRVKSGAAPTITAPALSRDIIANAVSISSGVRASAIRTFTFLVCAPGLDALRYCAESCTCGGHQHPDAGHVGHCGEEQIEQLGAGVASHI